MKKPKTFGRNFLKRYRKKVQQNDICVQSNSGLKKRSKLGNRFKTVDGMKFHSEFEAKCYEVIRDSGVPFSTQEVFEICPAFEYMGEKIRAVVYKADFVIKDATGKVLYIFEAKGFQTQESKMKMKLAKFAILQKFGRPIPIKLIFKENFSELKETLHKIKNLFNL